METQFLLEHAELLYHMLVKLPSLRLLLLHLRYIAKKHVGAKEGMAERNQAWGNYTIFLPSNDALEILEKSWKNIRKNAVSSCIYSIFLKENKFQAFSYTYHKLSLLFCTFICTMAVVKLLFRRLRWVEKLLAQTHVLQIFHVID